jgi:molybdopterin/thiamine biosynthesis adenylyltransferase
MLMGTRIVLLESQLETLRELLFDRPGVEGAAFLLCGQSNSDHMTKLVVNSVIAIADEDFLRREAYGLSISSSALTRVAKLARYEDLSIIFAHSHPDGIPDFSEQDDREEARLLPFLQARLPNRAHGTLVLTNNEICGRIYMPARKPVDSILVIGDRIRQMCPVDHRAVEPFFDRQVRAFGPDIQLLLKGMRVGVVGLGGTGSPIAEQLYRLGVGHISLFDGDTFDPTNVNRVYGSTLADKGRYKVEIASTHLARIGLGSVVDVYPNHITVETTALALRDCDVIFGCTDKEIPRAILVQLSLRYLIPVFDMGVLIDSDKGAIRGVHGRVTTLLPGEACLFCRGRISTERIRLEALSEADRKVQIRDGYAPELDEVAPAVIPFTSATASAAIGEFLHRLTGFMGSERQSSEVLLALDQSRVRTNRLESREECMCGDQSFWGRADTTPYLEMVWANPPK